MKKLVPLVACFFAFGCANTTSLPLAPETVSSLNGKTVTVVARDQPSFVAMTSSKGMFAVAGVGAAVVAGDDLVEESKISDPAIGIGDALAKTLKKKRGIKAAGRSDALSESSDAEDIAQLARGSDYALDVVTNGWGYIYDGFSFSDYFVNYSSSIRLIDTKSSEVVASGYCVYDAKKAGKPAVSHDTLIANDAAYIKQELKEAAGACIEKFSSETL